MSLIKTRYFTNRHNHYFAIKQVVDETELAQTDLVEHKTKEDMYYHISKQLNLPGRDMHGTEHIIENNKIITSGYGAYPLINEVRTFGTVVKLMTEFCLE